MPRGLGDVLHYFEPSLGFRPEPAEGDPTHAAPSVLALPLAAADVVGAALAWNLAAELARRGLRTRLLAPAEGALASLAPTSGASPLDAEITSLPTRDSASLARAAVAATPPRGAITLACVPGEDLEGSLRVGLRWILILTSPDRAALREATALAERALVACPAARVGVTVHGVRSVGEAERAFRRIAAAVEQHLGGGLCSYGLLVDDLAVYRAIVERRPVGLCHPQSPAARALADVARLLHADLAGAAP